MCRHVSDSAKVLDALKDPVNGYYDPRDIFTTVPRSSVLNKSYEASAPSSRLRAAPSKACASASFVNQC